MRLLEKGKEKQRVVHQKPYKQLNKKRGTKTIKKWRALAKRGVGGGRRKYQTV